MRLAAVLAAALTLIPCVSAGTAGARAGSGETSAGGGVRMGAGFARDASLGHASPLTLSLSVDPSRGAPPVTSVRLAYAKGLGLVSSGLGLASCTRPESEFHAILITTHGLGGCPANSVMAYGTVQANVVLHPTGQVIREYATLMVMSGPIEPGGLGLVIFIDGQRPFGARFILRGIVRGAHSPYAGQIAVRFPQVASLADLATVYLTDLQLTIGSPRIRYHDGKRPYRPEGIVLPNRCPQAGFVFAAHVRLRGEREARSAETNAPCPGLAARR